MPINFLNYYIRLDYLMHTHENTVPFFITGTIIYAHLKRRTTVTCKTDFRNRSTRDLWFMKPLYIWFIFWNPASGSSDIKSDESGIRMIVASDDDIMCWPTNIGENWSRNRSVKLVPEMTRSHASFLRLCP